MKEVKPTSLFKDRVREVEGNPDFSNKDIGASQPQLVTEINTGIMCTLNQDYAMESDETCIYNAAHLMVASLAGSLAHVTCKEPLCVSISSQLRNSLQGFNITN
ncbi:CCR4-NOT transcription complex subunit 1 [Camellia lanceoleosa]|uniref:CCR4-NOT transcription complex subunit 1 n=1 Tax=Camellia lanceoleosa TaxID=1840588 RepID=A0ACC0HX51_9ERIC|nr:CCR4-NOT transcription complex subunit 1 [Camellia lanceoleosa]